VFTRNLQDYTQIAVVGFGLTGASCVRFLQNHDVTPVLFDTREQPPGLETDAELAERCQCHFGPIQLENLLSMDLIILSPGLDKRLPAIAMAAKSGIPVISDIELFGWFAEAPIVAVTGSNGKSTVTELTTHILRELGYQASAGGNIGTPAVELLMVKPAADMYVLELSSFQLELVYSLPLRAAALLNVTPDHLDRYDSVLDYANAKQRIFENAETAIWNLQDEKTRPVKSAVAEITLSEVANDDFGIQESGSERWITFRDKQILRVDNLKLSGRHNWMNIQAALALCYALGVAVEDSAKKVSSYQPLPHRCQLVGEYDQIRWVDDSKATNPAAAVAAIQGFRPDVQEKLILIAGGDAKGADLFALKPALDQVDLLITLGKDGARIARLKDTAVQVKSIQEAVQQAAAAATPGSLVLLSPACASLDMFDNYQDRGRQFTKAVEVQYAS